MSRFLVRVRQFWTRDRLVPVLGITALALFLLNFWAFLGHQFNQVPFNGAYVLSANLPNAVSDLKGRHFLSHMHKHNHSHFRSRHFSYDHESKRQRCRKKSDRKGSPDQIYETRRFDKQSGRLHNQADAYRIEIRRLQKERNDQMQAFLKQREAELQQLKLTLDTHEHALIKEGVESLDQKIHVTRDEHGKSSVTITVDGETISIP